MHKQPLKFFRFLGPAPVCTLSRRPSRGRPGGSGVCSRRRSSCALVVRSRADGSLPFSRSPFFNREWTPSCRAPGPHGGLPSPSQGAPRRARETQRGQGPPLAQPCVARCLRWSHRRTQRPREACQRTSPSDYQGAPPVRCLVEPPSALLSDPPQTHPPPPSPR